MYKGIKSINTKISGPGPMEFFIGLVVGTVFSSVILTATKSGLEALQRIAKERIK